jgi:hypothetical protein
VKIAASALVTPVTLSRSNVTAQAGTNRTGDAGWADAGDGGSMKATQRERKTAT